MRSPSALMPRRLFQISECQEHVVIVTPQLRQLTVHSRGKAYIAGALQEKYEVLLSPSSLIHVAARAKT